MTPEQFINLVNQLVDYGQLGKDAWQEFYQLMLKVQKVVIKNDLELPLSQADVDYIIQVYGPLYNTALTKIEIAGDNLGSDAFH